MIEGLVYAPELLLVVGPIGVGKTTVMRSISSRLRGMSVTYGSIDFDEMGQCNLPQLASADGIFELRLRNAQYIADSFADAGAERILVCAAPRDPARLDRMVRVFHRYEIFVCHLRCSPTSIEHRIRARGRETGDLADHIDTAVKQVSHAYPRTDLLLDTSRISVDEAARAVLEAWDDMIVAQTRTGRTGHLPC